MIKFLIGVAIGVVAGRFLWNAPTIVPEPVKTPDDNMDEIIEAGKEIVAAFKKFYNENS